MDVTRNGWRGGGIQIAEDVVRMIDYRPALTLTIKSDIEEGGGGGVKEINLFKKIIAAHTPPVDSYCTVIIVCNFSENLPNFLLQII